MTLRLEWCTRRHAWEACAKWHYTGTAGSARLYPIGVWESGRFIGAVVFGDGPTPNMARSLGVLRDETRQLLRVALDTHLAPVSRIITIAVRMLRKAVPGLRVLVSFADPAQGHHGGIYQGAGWLYLGPVASGGNWILLHGKPIHPRSVVTRHGSRNIGWLRSNVDPSAAVAPVPGKHKYVLPLDTETRERLTKHAKPYPKRAVSIVADAPAVQAGEGGSVPTTALLGFGGAA